MSLNTASNFPNLSSLSPAILAYQFDDTQNTVQNAINNFLFDVSEVNYNLLVLALNSALLNFAVNRNSSLRILLTTSDGTVAYDSSRTNTWANFLTRGINENHQGRPEILLAVLTSSGVGLTQRYSNSLRKTQKYQANRLGDSTNDNVGTFRISLDDTI